MLEVCFVPLPPPNSTNILAVRTWKIMVLTLTSEIRKLWSNHCYFYEQGSEGKAEGRGKERSRGQWSKTSEPLLWCQSIYPNARIVFDKISSKYCISATEIHMIYFFAPAARKISDFVSIIIVFTSGNWYTIHTLGPECPDPGRPGGDRWGAEFGLKIPLSFFLHTEWTIHCWGRKFCLSQS